MKRIPVAFVVVVLAGWQAEGLCAPDLTLLHLDGRIDAIDPSAVCLPVAQGFVDPIHEGEHVLASGDVRNWVNTALFLVPWSEHPTAAVWTKPDKHVAVTEVHSALGVQFWNSDRNDGLADVYLEGGAFPDWTYVGSVDTYHDRPWPDGQDNYLLILGLAAGEYGVRVVADNMDHDVHLEAFCAVRVIPVPQAFMLGMVGAGSIAWLRRRKAL